VTKICRKIRQTILQLCLPALNVPEVNLKSQKYFVGFFKSIAWYENPEATKFISRRSISAGLTPKNQVKIISCKESDGPRGSAIISSLGASIM